MKPIPIIIKLIIIGLISVSISIFNQTVSPTIANELAMMQMSNSSDSSMWIQAYSIAMNYTWIIPVILFLILFHKELIYIIKKISKKEKGETTNETH